MYCSTNNHCSSSFAIGICPKIHPQIICFMTSVNKTIHRRFSCLHYRQTYHTYLTLRRILCIEKYTSRGSSSSRTILKFGLFFCPLKIKKHPDLLFCFFLFLCCFQVVQSEPSIFLSSDVFIFVLVPSTEVWTVISHRIT